MEFSIISPIYKGESMLQELVERIQNQMELLACEYEIILVNDASPDNSWLKIKEICSNDFHIKGINLSRNFGQHYAITAGLSVAKGKWVIVMDCDLQDQPEEIPNLYKKAQEGFDIVFAQRIERKDSFLKRLSSTLFYGVFSYLTETKQDKTVANFGIYHRKVTNSILAMGDSIRYFPTMVQWVGFRKAWLPVKHAEREDGSSGYNFRKLLNLAFNNIIAFSDKPIRLMMQFGSFITLFSIAVALFYLIKYLIGGIAVSGFTTIIISIWFLAGMIIMLLGCIGVYIGKIYDRVKQRPTFIIDEILNGEQ